jgi:hypothetical protein
MASSDDPKKPGARRSTVKPVRPGRDAVAGRPVAERDGYVTWELPEELLQVLMEIGAHAFSKTGDDKVWSLNGDPVYQALQRLVNGDDARGWMGHATELGLLPSPPTAEAVARFFRDTPGLDRARIGEFLSEPDVANPGKFAFNGAVRAAYA